MVKYAIQVLVICIWPEVRRNQKPEGSPENYILIIHSQYTGEQASEITMANACELNKLYIWKKERHIILKRAIATNESSLFLTNETKKTIKDNPIFNFN